MGEESLYKSLYNSLGLIYLDAVRNARPGALPDFPPSGVVNFEAAKEVLGTFLAQERPMKWLERLADQTLDQFQQNYEDTKARLLDFLISSECAFPLDKAKMYAMTLSLDLRVTNPPRSTGNLTPHGWWPHCLESVYGFTRDDAEKVRGLLQHPNGTFLRGTYRRHTADELEWFVAHPSSHPKIDKNKMIFFDEFHDKADPLYEIILEMMSGEGGLGDGGTLERFYSAQSSFPGGEGDQGVGEQGTLERFFSAQSSPPEQDEGGLGGEGQVAAMEAGGRSGPRRSSSGYKNTRSQRKRKRNNTRKRVSKKRVSKKNNRTKRRKKTRRTRRRKIRRLDPRVGWVTNQSGETNKTASPPANSPAFKSIDPFPNAGTGKGTEKGTGKGTGKGTEN